MSTIDNPFYGTFVFPTPVAVVNTLQPSAQPTIAQLPILTSLAPDGRFESEQSSLVPTYVSQELAVSVTELLADGEECPIGFLCDADRKANCTILRGLPISLGFGDIHAGLMCPANVSDYRNCPVGKYCPTPELVFECPEGKFCPHKTAEPTIDCNQCSVGSVQLERARYGYTLMIVLFVIVFCFFVWRVMKAANKKRYDEFVELANRRVSSIRLETYRSQRRNKLEKIKPRLDLIAARLRSSQEIFQAELSREPPVSGSASGSTSLPFTTSKSKSAVELHMDGTITFDARRLFDKVDTNGDGVLSYKELNLILELDTVALQEFVRRMNEGAGVSADCKYISRRVFVWHFVDVLAEASNFGPTAAEAAQLFDEIAERGINRNGEIEPETFYTSSLSRFLTDSQIHNLLVRLRSRQLERSSGKPSAWVPVQTSIRALTDINRRDRPSRAIRRDDFIAHYPTVLYEIVTEPDSLPFVSTCRPDIIPEQHEGVDIAFEELSLTVNVGGNTINVVDKVTGRLRAGTMTALMGGSGAGKSSLLNALCGRAFYGETSGTILVNGHLSTIEEHRDSVGFVPQDDIVYSELTVKENFMYAAKFQLDARTSLEDIEDLADATLANLGLSRVANSIVGDVNRRGVSGGEKKRVNIGLELMSRPRALFLDEPTSGLDSSSALLVMQSLRVLVENQGVTVCSVIHQPRKVIFDLFDDLILLGVGGKLVYNGPTEGAQKYVERLNYRLPPGDSVADWLIDVSSGRLEPEDVENETHGIEDSSEPIAKKRNFSQEEEYDHNAGPSSNKVEQEFEEAKIRREMLYESWSTHFDKLPGEDRARYSAPKPYALPEPVKRSSFLKQLTFQLRRNVLVTRRNSFSKLLDTFLIVGAVVLISAFEGVVEVTASSQPDVSFDALVSGDPLELAEQLPELFLYAIRGSNRLQEYALKTGVISAVLIGLTAAKTITDKRLEFFREAASGYDINAYFVAINITSSIEHSLQSLLAAFAALWLRDSLAVWHSYYVNFAMLSWLCVSWALLLPLLVPPDSVVLVTGFFMAFFGLLFSGGLSPVLYDDIYNGSSLLALFSSFASTTRFFIEGLTVAEHRCLPEQSGFTQTADAVNFPVELNSFGILGLAQNDGGVRVQSCSGWYWGVLPAFLVGLTIRVVAGSVIHVSDRSKQAKRTLWNEMQMQASQKGIFKGINMAVAVFVLVIAALFSLATWAILREV